MTANTLSRQTSGQYRTIVADPPWPFEWQGAAGGRRGNATTLGYVTEPYEAILALGPGNVDGDATLLLWVTQEALHEGWAARTAKAWGFPTRVGEFIWRKPNFGAGLFPRIGHETCVIYKRGKGSLKTDEAPRNVHSVQTWKQTYSGADGKKHSAKPEGFYDRVEEGFNGPYLEMFARRARFGWDYSGDESLGTAELPDHSGPTPVGMSEGLGILPDGYFANLAREQKLVPAAELGRAVLGAGDQRLAFESEITRLRAENADKANLVKTLQACRRDDQEIVDALRAENEALKAENASLREDLGYRPRENNGYCLACGCYMPQTLDGTKRVHDCDRTPPLGKLPSTIYACPTCAGHAPFSAGCWGTEKHPHEHVFMRPIHELLRGAPASDEQEATK